MDELFIQAKIDNMDAVLEFIESKLEDCPSNIKNKIGIVVDEIFSNIARYAYHPSTGFVTVRINVEDVITIEFEDSGKPYDPLAKDDPDTSLPVEERKIGGLGIFIIKKIMDSIEYRHEDGKNILLVKKNLA